MTKPKKAACVYRVFDSEGTLLYVGCTINLPQRLALHTYRSWWYCKSHRVATEWFDDRKDAPRRTA